MRNWLIRALGGVTFETFSEVFMLATKDREVMQQAQDFYKSQYNARQSRIEYLEHLILTKVGYIANSDSDSTGHKEFQPIGGQNTWGKVKHNLEMADRKLMQERNKNAH